jgi:hypothetical protein
MRKKHEGNREPPRDKVINICGFFPNNKPKNHGNSEICAKLTFFSGGNSLIVNVLNSGKLGENYRKLLFLFAGYSLIVNLLNCDEMGKITHFTQ